MGIEPTRPAWKAGILPLNYTRSPSHQVTNGIIPQPLWFVKLFLKKIEDMIFTRIKEYMNNIKILNYELLNDSNIDSIAYYLYNDMSSSIIEAIDMYNNAGKRTAIKSNMEIPYLLECHDVIDIFNSSIKDLNRIILTEDLISLLYENCDLLDNKILNVSIKTSVVKKNIIIRRKDLL